MAKKNKGYIPISRGLFEHRFWCEERCYSRFEAWLYLIKEAKIEDTKLYLASSVFIVKRGQLSVSLRFLAQAFGWSKNRVSSYLKLLQDDNMIEVGTSKGTAQTLITICNYEAYNNLNQITGQQKGQRRDSTGTAQGQNIKNINNINNTDTNVSVSSDCASELSFDFVWDLYDKKVGNIHKLQKKWDALCTENKRKVIAYIPRYIAAQPDKQYRKNFETFLNNQGWEDEIITTNTNNATTQRTNTQRGCTDEELLRAVAEGYARANTKQEWQ